MPMWVQWLCGLVIGVNLLGLAVFVVVFWLQDRKALLYQVVYRNGGRSDWLSVDRAWSDFMNFPDASYIEDVHGNRMAYFGENRAGRSPAISEDDKR